MWNCYGHNVNTSLIHMHTHRQTDRIHIDKWAFPFACNRTYISFDSFCTWIYIKVNSVVNVTTWDVCVKSVPYCVLCVCAYGYVALSECTYKYVTNDFSDSTHSTLPLNPSISIIDGFFRLLRRVGMTKNFKRKNTRGRNRKKAERSKLPLGDLFAWESKSTHT